MKRPSWTVNALAVVVLAILPVSAAAEIDLVVTISVAAGEHDRSNTPLVARLPFAPSAVSRAEVVVKDARGQLVPAQLVTPGLLARRNDQAELHWILPRLKAGATAHFSATLVPRSQPDAAPTGFGWHDTPGRHADVVFLERGRKPRGFPRKVVRYMYRAYENDPAKRDLDNKPFHHVFDPSGSRIVTKGTGGMYTHHQGLFYGFTRCTFPGGQCNTWYCHEGEHQLHRKVLAQSAGAVLARHRTLVDWNDRQGKAFCREHRELSVFAVPHGTLIEWSSRLWSVRGTVTLDGDAQHAGFQFRADDEVAKRQDEKLVYYLRPDGKGEPGATRNPVKGKRADDPVNKAVVNQPWNVMSFVLGSQRYSTAYIDSPRNPRPSFASERAYGRFGGWFGKQTLVEGGRPIEIRYRVWLQRGEMTAAVAQGLSRDFAVPPRVSVSR